MLYDRNALRAQGSVFSGIFHGVPAAIVGTSGQSHAFTNVLPKY